MLDLSDAFFFRPPPDQAHPPPCRAGGGDGDGGDAVAAAEDGHGGCGNGEDEQDRAAERCVGSPARAALATTLAAAVTISGTAAVTSTTAAAACCCTVAAAAAATTPRTAPPAAAAAARSSAPPPPLSAPPLGGPSPTETARMMAALCIDPRSQRQPAFRPPPAVVAPPPGLPRGPAGPGPRPLITPYVKGARSSPAAGGKPPTNSKSSAAGVASVKSRRPRMTLSALGSPPVFPFSNFTKYVDPSGRLNFSGKAVLHAQGVDFSSGPSYKINMAELQLLEELGKGQYGTVQRVFHRPTNVTMAMKEIRLELDQAKLNQILMELDILHGSQSPYIVEFYGAFFIESCVYYCMELMDAGSLDRLYGENVPEDVMSKITFAVVNGLKFFKDKLSIIHRDVKPTNVLVNFQGEVKLCDFGVSGQLIQSLARTNVGCQSYMAPERISSAAAGVYTVQADVWSLGLSLLEVGRGEYPYPPDKYDSVFAQLTAIAQGEPPPLSPAKYSFECRDFVSQCLRKDPKLRPTYAALLEHAFIKKHENEPVDMKSWVRKAYASRKSRTKSTTSPE